MNITCCYLRAGNEPIYVHWENVQHSCRIFLLILCLKYLAATKIPQIQVYVVVYVS